MNIVRSTARQRFPPDNLKRWFSVSTTHHADFTHAIVGAGAVGLAIARQLQRRGGVSTVLIEQHEAVGTETSSRNSEVIHAGLYYGADSMKTRLCIRGRKLLYDLCEKQGIEHRNTGKWIVAQNDAEFAQLQKIYDFSKTIGVATRFLSIDEGRRQEPEVQAKAGILESPTTGIVDSHGYMQYLLGDFQEHGGVTALMSEVTRILPRSKGSGGWDIWTKSRSEPDAAMQDELQITADVIINSAGLYAVPVSNWILPKERHIKPFYAKGTYYSYGASRPKTKTLIYPAPVPGHGGLGTHLTLDLSGRIRFGPDLQWIDSPTDYEPSDEHLPTAIEEITRYLPGIDQSALSIDYCGIRPKLSGTSAQISGKGFQDFIVRREAGFDGFINLLGIESPGLTSSLAIAELVETLLYKT